MEPQNEEKSTLKQDIIKYLREGSILIGGLILLEFVFFFPQELVTAGIDVETLTYVGEVSLLRALGYAFIRAIIRSVVEAFKKIARQM